MHLFHKKLQDAIDKGLDKESLKARDIIVNHLNAIPNEKKLIAKLNENMDKYSAYLHEAIKHYSRGEHEEGNAMVVKAKLLLEWIHKEDVELVKGESRLK